MIARWPVLLVALFGCSDYGYTSRTTLDSFQQSRLNAVDLLIVIDNSCSMVEEQDNLSVNFDSLISIFSQAEVDWQIAVTTTDVESDRFRGLLQGGDDEIIVVGPQGEIDRVAYDRTWPLVRGTALQLDPVAFDPTQNDTPDVWCAATDPYGTVGGLGSPGVWNHACSGDDVVPPPGQDDGPVAPSPGTLVVSEIMSQSPGLDSLCEWFELTNTTDDTLDLTGVTLTDLGNNAAALSDDLMVGPYGSIVVGRSADEASACGAPVDVAIPTGFVLNDDARVITPDSPDGADLFAELVAQGTIGTGIEMGLEGARLVFEEPYFSEQNQGFLREDAALSILFVSDEEDLSPLAAYEYVRYFTDLKGDDAYRDPGQIRLSAVVGKDPPPDADLPSCESDNGFASYGRRYLEVAAETEGVAESICEEDFAPIVEKLGLTLTGLLLEFQLSDLPKLETLVVKLYETDDEASLVRELVADVDYTYVAEGNVLRFEEEQVPPSEYWITAEYEVLPTGATVSTGTAVTRGVAR